MQNDTIQRENILLESIKELECINKKLAKLTVRREELVDQVISTIGHQHEGQKTYEYDIWKIEVKTPFVYSLNKKLWESGTVKLPKKFNPIKESTSYSIDKRLCDDLLICAPDDIRDTIIELIEKKPGKANVVIKERI